LIEKYIENTELFFKWALVMAAARISEDIPKKEKNILKIYILENIE
jgi:hypothetical protein